MGAPAASKMIRLAKTRFASHNLTLPTEWKPHGGSTKKMYPRAFTAAELATEMLPLGPSGAGFKAASANQYHTKAQKVITGVYYAYIDGICKAICCAWTDWVKTAVLTGCTVNASIAAGGVVVGPPWTPIIIAKGPSSTTMAATYTKAIAKAVGDAWSLYEKSIKSPGLPFYPPFSAWPGPMAPPTENVPTPLTQLVQVTAPLLTDALKAAIGGNLLAAVTLDVVDGVSSGLKSGMATLASALSGGAGAGAAASAAGKAVAKEVAEDAARSALAPLLQPKLLPHYEALSDSIAWAFEQCFNTWQATTMVTKVMGMGPVPSFAPPPVPVGPVVAGVGNMLPGGFGTGAPDTGEINRMISEGEGREAKVYTDTKGHPTVGVGFNLDREGAKGALEAVGADYDKVRAGTETLSETQIDSLLEKDMQQAIKDSRDVVKNYDSLPPEKQAVVTDMVFNMGKAKFAKFKDTIKAIESNDFAKAAEGMKDSAWYDQVGDRAKRNVALMQENPCG